MSQRDWKELSRAPRLALPSRKAPTGWCALCTLPRPRASPDGRRLETPAGERQGVSSDGGLVYQLAAWTDQDQGSLIERPAHLLAIEDSLSVRLEDQREIALGTRDFPRPDALSGLILRVANHRAHHGQIQQQNAGGDTREPPAAHHDPSFVWPGGILKPSSSTTPPALWQNRTSLTVQSPWVLLVAGTPRLFGVERILLWGARQSQGWTNRKQS